MGMAGVSAWIENYESYNICNSVILLPRIRYMLILSIECAHWPKLHVMFKVRDTTS